VVQIGPTLCSLDSNKGSENSSSTKGGRFLETVLTIRFSKAVFCEVNSKLGIHSSILFTVDDSHISHVFNTICYTLLKWDFQVILEKYLENIPETHLRTRA
jgi:hypothetical protein